ncbi:helicase-related protein [Pseudomonas chlororaphis]|uniref:helicase-related protein n=1 Tax=Pseudomonas chlororaphis TaxID=587753 RepID=UPI000F6B34E7|nr:helicase-related protein [Pseudomonas chlororaphis]AZD79038.1 Superfamily II DNA and RNA helicase [Pseudomonas chlororaphis subsp. aurantiaca]
MNKERSAEIEFLRGELVGPARPLEVIRPGTMIILDAQGCFRLPDDTNGTLYYQCDGGDFPQEIVHYRGETPVQRYGVGLLHPRNDVRGAVIEGPAGSESFDGQTAGGESDQNASAETVQAVVSDPEDTLLHVESASNETGAEISGTEADDDDFEVSSADMYQPSVMGISFCLEEGDGEFVVSLPPIKKFFWQLPEAAPFQVNGRYEPCIKVITKEAGEHRTEAWRRVPATTVNTSERFLLTSLESGKSVSRDLSLSGGLALQIQVFPRRMHGKWIITCVLRNQLDTSIMKSKTERLRGMLFQAYFEVSVQGGAAFSCYPEGVRPFGQLDDDEQTLSLLYRDETTWSIGHGCAAGWSRVEGVMPDVVFADVMPAVELPSMTPDIRGQNGEPVTLSMRELAGLPSFAEGGTGWETLDRLAGEYAAWIEAREADSAGLKLHLREVAARHLEGCRQCLVRIRNGIAILQEDEVALEAFRLANQSMMLQQIASKQIMRRPLVRFDGHVMAEEVLEGQPRTPWKVWADGSEKPHIGNWRAFQAAFVLMSIAGLVDGRSDDRDVVDLIWFPTGGGKTEAYLAVAAFYMFHQRLIARPDDSLRRDGTNVFMRYTLRMLTTQQFQRAASLICAMEQIRIRRKEERSCPQLGETSFSLGLWIGAGGSPNTWADAATAIRKYDRNDVSGNPLVLTECPWCRSTIGRLESRAVGRRNQNNGNNLAGLAFSGNRPYLKCSDISCEYGGERDRLPVEVIDEAIYDKPPSMFIGTADKFAMMAWKPETGALFGFHRDGKGNVHLVRQPPGLIIQDEFHLISGPLGTIYGLYEGVIERFCTAEVKRRLIRPKIIASTATIRGATEQVRTVYARQNLQLFPNPGLVMGDSFFGCYARTNDGRLAEGRLYLGIHATGYRSFLTAQVRTFSAALFRAGMFEDQKDAWWTLLAFYNSLRELGGAQTLFHSDISARMKDYSFRYGLIGGMQRYLNTVEELTSRQSQAQLVELMDRLTLDWNDRNSIDVCLASNIIEVGVDIDRLALMAVVGQPKSTAQYIQVTGRVGRRWDTRPGLILSMFNPSKSRDRSHFEQFHSYHRRLYERVEPTSATPFSVEAVERALTGVLLVWARQCHDAKSPGESFGDYNGYLEEAFELLLERCEVIMEKQPRELARVCDAMRKVHSELRRKWQANPQEWWAYPQKKDGEYLMLWSGVFATREQKLKGARVLSSMRNVDGTARAAISDNYFAEEHKENGQ